MSRMIGILIIIIFIVILWTYSKFSEDKLRQYRDALGLEKANLIYANDYQKVRDLILPTRQTAFAKSEPVIWLYRNGDLELFLGTNQKSDVRLWLEPKTVLQGVHIVLGKAASNSLRTNLKKNKLPKQQVGLEGNFSKQFKLYCNEGQQVIALQIIAPDIMAYILDNLLGVDIEITDTIYIVNDAKSEEHFSDTGKLFSTIEVILDVSNEIHAFGSTKTVKMILEEARKRGIYFTATSIT